MPKISLVSADAQHIRELNILSPKFGIAPEHWAIVRGILRRHVPGSAVWAFGSRAGGIARRYSDLCFAVISDEPMSIDALAALKEAFADSDLPWTVDVVDWAGISDRFRRIIERQRVVLDEDFADQRIGESRAKPSGLGCGWCR